MGIRRGRAWFACIVIVGFSGCTTLGSAIDRFDGCVPGSEICLDGIDNDCDDIIDEPACTPEWLLDGGVCGAERCGNGVDDDCDEQVDELCDQACTEIAADVTYVIDSSSGEIRVSGVAMGDDISSHPLPSRFVNCLEASIGREDFIVSFVMGEDGRYAIGGMGGPSATVQYSNCVPAGCSVNGLVSGGEFTMFSSNRGDTRTIVVESSEVAEVTLHIRYVGPIQ